ncbi:MAG: cytidylate kinase [Flavobacteriales bacterium]|nr:cytidylate kinase [Flavobacteriales bacterium]|tara:strand:+ start:883 stop:1587 length:705 start_codon:yes stop_codon:yes gene_type:complete
MKKITIAIDGFSSCGKSTLAKELAKTLSYSYVDTGAMFRAVALYCLRNGLIKEDGTKVYKIREFLDEFQVGFEFNEKKGYGEVTLNGENVEEEIRSLTISRIVTKISGIKEVREKLLIIQKQIGSDKGVVLDGRDIGTVVFPDAELKIFMTAETIVRSKRRLNELKGKGHKVTLEQVQENLRLRDYDDTTREESPLKQASDAVVIDNTNLTKRDQLSMIVALAKERMVDEDLVE